MYIIYIHTASPDEARKVRGTRNQGRWQRGPLRVGLGANWPNTTGERVLSCARTGNTELLQDIIDKVDEPVALLNEARDGLGNGVFHLCCAYRMLETLDFLLDIDGLDLNVQNVIGRGYAAGCVRPLTPCEMAIRRCTSP